MFRPQSNYILDSAAPEKARTTRDSRKRMPVDQGTYLGSPSILKKPKPNSTTATTGSSNAPPAPSRAKPLTVSFDSNISITDDFDDNYVPSPPTFDHDPHLSSSTTTSTPLSPPPAAPPATQVIPLLHTPITLSTESNEYHYSGTPLLFKASFYTPAPTSTSNTIVLSQQEYTQLLKDSQTWQVKYAGVASEVKALRE